MELNLFIHKTALHIAAKKNNFDIINILLFQPKIDINIKTIHNLIFYRIDDIL